MKPGLRLQSGFLIAYRMNLYIAEQPVSKKLTGCSAAFYASVTYTTDFSPRVFSIRSMMPRVMTIIRVARAAMVGSK